MRIFFNFCLYFLLTILFALLASFTAENFYAMQIQNKNISVELKSNGEDLFLS